MESVCGMMGWVGILKSDLVLVTPNVGEVSELISNFNTFQLPETQQLAHMYILGIILRIIRTTEK